jgi:hypothetical protein
MFGPQCYQRSDCKGENWDWVHTQYYVHEDILKCLDSPRWDLRRTFRLSRFICSITDFFVRHLLLLCRMLLHTLRTPLIAVIQGVIGWSLYATSCCYAGCYWMVPVRHFLLLCRVLLDGPCMPLLAVMQGRAKTFDTRCLTCFFYC